MAGSGKKWLIGCGAGCGGVLVLGIILSVVGTMMMMRPLNDAVDAQRQLTERYGVRDDYRPAGTGITAERLDRFVAVRREVITLCDQFGETAETFATMDRLDEEENPSKGEVFGALGDVMGGVFGIVDNLGALTRLRNEALLAQEMALGEYVWLYTLVYHSWLGHPTNVSFDDRDGADLARGEKVTLQTFARRYGEALTAAGRADEGAVWTAEADRMERSDQGVPFGDGSLPQELADLFERYGDELRALYCAPMTAFECNEIEKRGLSIQAH